MTFDEVLTKIQRSCNSGRALRFEAMSALAELPNYSWCGVYRLEGDMLLLDEYVGEATDHTEIPVGRGVCGTAVAEDTNQVIKDVRELSNYLSCSFKTRSEIVVLIKREGITLGQLDIDGHEVGAFGVDDEAFLESLAGLLAERW